MSEKIKKILFVIVINIVFIVLATQVLSLGIGPVYTHIEFQPNLIQEYKFSVYNNDNQNSTIKLSVSGELAEYITIPEKEFTLGPEEESKEVNFIISLPRELTPGDYASRIIVNQEIQNQGMIGAQASVSHKIDLKVPAHGKYIRSEVKQKNGSMQIEIENIGVKTIENLNTEIYLSGENNSVFESNLGSLTSGDIKTTEYIPNMKGEFHSSAIITYDGLRKNISQIIQFGEPTISILDFKPVDYKPGEINEFRVNVSSDWNKELNLTIKMDIVDENGLSLVKAQTKKAIIDKKEVVIYADTKDLKPNTYGIKLLVEGKKQIYTEEMHLVELKSIETTQEVKKINNKIDWRTAIISSMILLTIALLVLLPLKVKINRRREKISQKKGKL